MMLHEFLLGVVPMRLPTGVAIMASVAYRYAGNVRSWVYEDAGTFIEHQLINGELDAALMMTSTLESASSFATMTLVRSPWCLWAPSRHRLARATAVSVEDLRDEPVVELRSEDLERAAGDLWRRSGHDPRIAVRSRSVEATRNLVATGCGVSILPEVLFRAWSLDGQQLAAVPLADAPSPLAIGVVWRQGAPISAAIEAFIAVASEHGISLGLKRELSDLAAEPGNR